jgi:hypothetical protein
VAFPDCLRIGFNSDFPVLLRKDHDVTLASGYPKDIKEFNLDKHVFKKVMDLHIGDEVITY